MVQGNNPFIPTTLGGNPPIPTAQGGSSPVPTTHPPSSLVTSFDWSRLAGHLLLPYVPFHIIVQSYNVPVPGTVINEGASVSILSSTTWQSFCSSQLMPVT